MAQNNENSSNGNIPDDLAFIILSKLPLKSLKRFTCVKKSWALLFDDPHFMSMYCRNFISNSHYGNDSRLLLRRTVNCTENLNEPLYGDPRELIWISGERFVEKVNLNQICPLEPSLDARLFYLFGFGNGIHGIICICVPCVKESNLFSWESTVLLWNPAIGESIIVPPGPFNSNPPPSNYAIVHCGFGYDHVGDDYKLIQCIYSWTNEFNNIWEIYSVRSNTWRKLDVNMACGIPLDHRLNQVYLNGVCHWKAYEEMHLVSFNLRTEVVLMTPYPVDKRDDQMDVVLDVLNGSIALISNENNSICISILGEIGVEESWTKLFTFGPLPCNFYFLAGVGNKGDILYITKDNQLASFDLSTQMVEEIGFKGEMHENQIMIYKESLLPIRGINN